MTPAIVCSITRETELIPGRGKWKHLKDATVVPGATQDVHRVETYFVAIEIIAADFSGRYTFYPSDGLAPNRAHVDYLEDHLPSLTPLGANMFVEGSTDLFAFPNPVAKPYHRIVIHETPLANGWALPDLFTK